MEDAVVFSDGGCIGNPGPGGWAAIVITGDLYEEFGGGEPATTNNRMELTGAIEGLKRTPRGSKVRVVTDSRYVTDGASKWLHGWKRRGWLKADGHPVLNRDLWELLDEAAGGRKVVWEHVDGHSGHPENERCDRIANGFARGVPPELKKGDGGWIFADGETSTGENVKYPKPLYLSVVEGAVEEHKSWAECEARIKGRKGAKCKKVSSRFEHIAAIKAWGDLA